MMADLGVHLTDKRMKSLTKRLNEVYNQAYVESVENNKSAIEKLSQVKNDINSGKYDNLNDDQKTAKINAYTLQVMRTENIVDDMSKRINNAGVTAQNIIRGEMNGIYALNRDYSNYSILKQSGVDYSFSQYDMNQIAVLVQEGESPFTKIAYEKMGKNSKIVKKLQNELIKATINGESQSQIMKRIKGITGQEGYNARRVAQTERTRVQTQARMMSIREAEAIGIGVDKQWVARMVRTRESHQDVHLQIVRSDEVFNNGLEFPGDPKGSAAETINCHCYVKPMVKSVSPSLAAHRADYQAMSFGQYQKRLKSSQIDDIIEYKSFSSAKTLNAHVKKHLSEYEGFTKKDYINRAKNLLNTPASETILGFRGDNGKTYRYDTDTNDFAVGNKNGTIATLFKPKDKARYWERQVEKYGKS